ncbi:hypothetical protein M1M86_02450 [Dehalococcoidales bacterium]|nr:hypothetical protein [Dehalococcoidales bacterium]
MKTNHAMQVKLLRHIRGNTPVSAVAILNKEKLVKVLKECGVITDLAQLRNKVLIIKRIITSPETKERD